MALLGAVIVLGWAPAARAQAAGWDRTPAAAWDVSTRGSVQGVVHSIDEDRGVAVIESDDAVIELRATPQQLAALVPDQARDFAFVRLDGSRWLVEPAPVVLQRGPTVEYVVGTVRGVDLREGRLSIDQPDNGTVSLDAHPQAIAGLREHQEVVIVAERIGDRLWVVAVRDPDPADLLDAPTATAGRLELLAPRGRERSAPRG